MRGERAHRRGQEDAVEHSDAPGRTEKGALRLFDIRAVVHRAGERRRPGGIAPPRERLPKCAAAANANKTGTRQREVPAYDTPKIPRQNIVEAHAVVHKEHDVVWFRLVVF